jgi:hypothetical protein
MPTAFRSMNPTVSRAFRAIGWDSPSFRFPDSMPDRWIVRQGMRYHLTPALCGRNRWKMEFSRPNPPTPWACPLSSKAIGPSRRHGGPAAWPV